MFDGFLNNAIADLSNKLPPPKVSSKKQIKFSANIFSFFPYLSSLYLPLADATFCAFLMSI